MSAIQDQRDGPIPMAVEQGAPAAAKRELSPSSAHDASDAPSAKKAKQEDDGDGAFANGVAVRELDFNDTYLAADFAHPSDAIAPLLAVAQQTGRTGADLIPPSSSPMKPTWRWCGRSTCIPTRRTMWPIWRPALRLVSARCCDCRRM